jgi:hypothetical protein
MIIFSFSDSFQEEYSEETNADFIVINIIFIILLAVSVLAVLKGIQIKNRIKRFKRYVALISAQEITSIEKIASSTMQSADFVHKDLQKMIDSNFFANATIDMSANVIIIGRAAAAYEPKEPEMFICVKCGASGTKPKGAYGSCDYCGTEVL